MDRADRDTLPTAAGPQQTLLSLMIAVFWLSVDAFDLV